MQFMYDVSIFKQRMIGQKVKLHSSEEYVLVIFVKFISLQHLLYTFSLAQIEVYGLRNNEVKLGWTGFFRCRVSFLEKVKKTLIQILRQNKSLPALAQLVVNRYRVAFLCGQLTGGISTVRGWKQKNKESSFLTVHLVHGKSFYA